jgi:hypothetical protein
MDQYEKCNSLGFDTVDTEALDTNTTSEYLVDPHPLVIDSVNRFFSLVRVLQLARVNVLLLMRKQVGSATREMPCGLGDTYQAMDGVRIHLARHLVAVASDMPGEHRSKVCEAVELVEATLRKPEPVRLAAFDEVWLACRLVGGPEATVAHRRIPVLRHGLVAVRCHFVGLFDGKLRLTEHSTLNIGPLNGS